mmetsp:Transcript_7179/g.25628  ORF Transcript_7179/g.25628 Transcript_7179/m.25628 type:complete len:393 (-) Transcript_7179:110-1288(-)
MGGVASADAGGGGGGSVSASGMGSKSPPPAAAARHAPGSGHHAGAHPHGLPPGAVPGSVVHVLWPPHGGGAGRSPYDVEIVDDEEDDMTLPVNLAAGALAGLVADTCTHPFETLSTRAKVHPGAGYGGQGLWAAARLIVAEEGVRGLLAGVSITMCAAAPCTAVYFAVYETAKKAGLARITDERLEPAVFFAAGAVSELGSTVLFLPAEVVKNRLQLGANPARATAGRVSLATNHSGPVAAARHILAVEGVAGMWAGWRACLLQDMAFSAVQFLVYEEYCRLFRSTHGGRDLRPEETVLAGATAGGVSALLTNPLDLTTTRLMTQGLDRSFGSGIAATIAAARREGPRSLWRGSLARVLATAPLSAITFSVYEAAKRQFQKWADDAESRPWT